MNLGQALGSAVADSVRESTSKTGIWKQVGESVIALVREVVAERDPVFYEVWQTANDERTCPICGQLDGEVWEQGEGFVPPVHDFCRCERVYHHVEFRVRYVVRWRTERREIQRWRYTIT